MKSRTILNKHTLLVATAALLTLTASIEAKSASARYSRCAPKRDLEMDTCASKMGFLGDHTFTVPKNLTAMTEYCGQLKESIGCIQSYAHDCLQGFTRQLLTSLLKRGKQQYKLICSTDTSKGDFLAKMACLSDDRIPGFHRCMDASIARFEYIESQARPEHRLPGVCCSYQIFNRDVDATLSRICGSNSSSTGELVHRLVSGTAGEFFSLICDQHRSLAECKASSKTGSMLPHLEDVTRRVEAGKLAPKGKSLVPVLLQILDASAGGA